MQKRFARVDPTDRLDQLLRLDVLQQIASGARPYGREHLLVVDEARQHDHLRRGAERADLADGLNAIEAWHYDVDEHDVWLQLTHPLDSLDAIHGLADDVDVRLGTEESLEPLPHDRMVVSDQHAGLR